MDQRVLKKEKPIRFKLFCEPYRFDRSYTFVHIVQQFHLKSNPRAQMFEYFGDGLSKSIQPGLRRDPAPAPDTKLKTDPINNLALYE